MSAGSSCSLYVAMAATKIWHFLLRQAKLWVCFDRGMLLPSRPQGYHLRYVLRCRSKLGIRIFSRKRKNVLELRRMYVTRMFRVNEQLSPNLE